MKKHDSCIKYVLSLTIHKLGILFQYQKSTNTNKETEETMKVLETDKSIADNKIDKVCQKKEKPTKNSDFTLEEERKTAKELKGE